MVDDLEIRKKVGWRSALGTVIVLYHNIPGNEDTTHCAFFVADCLKAMTDVDLAASYRGMGRAEAEAAIHSDGYSDHVDVVLAHFEEIHPSRAAHGDVAVLPPDALGIVNGGQVAVMTPSGLGHLPLAKALRAFRVL